MRVWLLAFLAVAVSPGLGQVGLYGPVRVHLKAGDVAPDISFARMLSGPGAASWSQTDLTGQMTVVVFYPDTSHNLESVTRWNAVVEKFAGKPVQFVWVTGEKEDRLLPWLNEHPVKGWVFFDPEGKTGKAYGLELPAEVIVGADRKIVGFSRSMSPTEDQLNAALDGRITTAPQSQATIKAFIANHMVLMDAEPPWMPRMNDDRPHFAPSYTLHVSIAKGEGRSDSSSDEFLSMQGVGLKDAIERVYGVNPIRVHLPAALDDGKRYDFALVLPESVSREKMNELFEQGLLDHFHLTGRRENRLVDVYVVTAVPGRLPPALKAQIRDGMGSVQSSGFGFEFVSDSDEVPTVMKPVSLGAMSSLSAEGTVDFLCHELETSLDRPVVNETNLEGAFEFRVKSSEKEKNDFLERLREKTGLVISPGQRNVEVLVFEGR
jgi:uncharacterized protein (TIGR03435 family)